LFLPNSQSPGLTARAPSAVQDEHDSEVDEDMPVESEAPPIEPSISPEIDIVSIIPPPQIFTPHSSYNPVTLNNPHTRLVTLGQSQLYHMLQTYHDGVRSMNRLQAAVNDQLDVLHRQRRDILEALPNMFQPIPASYRIEHRNDNTEAMFIEIFEVVHRGGRAEEINGLLLNALRAGIQVPGIEVPNILYSDVPYQTVPDTRDGDPEIIERDNNLYNIWKEFSKKNLEKK
jgi:hypothetical protein